MSTSARSRTSRSTGAIATTAWSELLSALIADIDLSEADTSWVMTQIMDGNATGAQIAAFAVALRAKGETAAEVSGLVGEMLDRSEVIEVSGLTLDVVGTGGDLANTVNISTMSAIVAAAAGARVAKHGNRAATSKCGSADVLAELGVTIDLPPAAVKHCIESIGIGFCYAPVFHPAMRHAAAARREIGVPTVFNILGPLSNPVRPSAQLIGCADERLAPVMAQVLADRGTNALVVRGMDGLDEVTVFDATDVWDATHPGVVETTSIYLGATGVEVAAPGSLDGDDAVQNALVLRQVLAGETDGRLRAIRDAVALNTAAALVAWDAAAGHFGDDDVTTRVRDALPRAYEAIDSGASTSLLERWSSLSVQLAK